MPTYDVRVWCDDNDHKEWKYETQATLDPNFIPSECTGHTAKLRDFVIENEDA